MFICNVVSFLVAVATTPPDEPTTTPAADDFLDICDRQQLIDAAPQYESIIIDGI